MASSAATSARSRSQGRDVPLLGCEEPRIYTPPLRGLTPETSLGFAVIAFADDMLGMSLLPWQKWLLIHMLELLPDNSLRFRTVVVLVSRQNGKSTLSVVLALWFQYCYGLGLILGTAQDLDTAEEVWQLAVDLVTEEDEDDQPVRPELHALVSDVVKVNGKKALVVGGKGTGMPKRRRYKVKAANRRAGRGLSGELVLLDELREHQSWDAWGSITKTTIAKSMALVLAMSNAGDSTSIVLRHLRKLAHGRLGDPDGIVAADDQLESDAPSAEELKDFDDDAVDLLDDLEDDDDTLGLFEWSAPPDCDVWDRDGWAQANPSLGYTIQEKTLASACATDPEWVFRTECMCQWPGGTLAGPFPTMTWDAGRWDGRGEAPRIVGKVRACVAMSHDRRTTAVAYAGHRADGIVQVEIVAMRAGSAWVNEWFSEEKRRERVEAIVGLKGGPEGELLKELKADGLPVFEWAGDNVAGWTGEVFDLVSATRTDAAGDLVAGLAHMPQPALDVAAGNARTRPMGLRFVWDPVHSEVDICTLIAATGAVGHLLTQRDATPPPAPVRAGGPATATTAPSERGPAHDSPATAGF